MGEHDADTKALEEFRRIIEESPLGTDDARAIRSRVPRERAEELARRLAADDTNDIDSLDDLDRQLRDLLTAPDNSASHKLIAYTDQAARSLGGAPESPRRLRALPAAGVEAGVSGEAPPGAPDHEIVGKIAAPKGAPPIVQPNRRSLPLLGLVNRRRDRELLSTDEIVAGIAEIVNEVTGIEPAEITSDKSFTDDLNVDSLSMVQIAVLTEQKYAVKIPDADLMRMRTVGDVVAYIQQLEKDFPDAIAVLRKKSAAG